MAQTLTEIKQLLAQHGLRPKHRYGQNFLHDGNHMRRIMEAAEIHPGETVLEVGPGTGALTERLLEAGARVLAVEIDRDLEPILRERLADYGDRFRLYVGDILEKKHTLNPQVVRLLDSVLSNTTHGEENNQALSSFKLIANLPYNVASPLLINLAVDHPAMSCAVVMVQREVADRITADPGGKDYGPMSVILQTVCDASVVGTLSPACFWPAPKVASAVVRLVRKPGPLPVEPKHLSRTVQLLFQKRRKQIGAILGRDTPLPDGINPNARPESLSVEQFARLARCMG